MKQRLRIMVKKLRLLLLAALLLTACATGASDTLSPLTNQDPAILGGAQISNPLDPLAGDAPVPGVDLVTLQTPLPETVMPLVNIAIQDLAQRLGVGLDEITVVRYEEVIWPDASLGCPQPGMDYAQVITPGYLLILSREAEFYEYHTNLNQDFVLCEVNRVFNGKEKGLDFTLKDGGPNQPKEWGEVDTDRITPVAPNQ